MPSVLVLGCGGNAGRNYVSSLQMGVHDLASVGIDENYWRLRAANVDIKY